MSNQGTIVQVLGPVVECGLQRIGQTARHLRSPRNHVRRGRRFHPTRPRSPAAPRTGLGPHGRDEFVRRLKRGLKVTATGDGISVPVGEGVLGRVFNVTVTPSMSAVPSPTRSVTRSTVGADAHGAEHKVRGCSRPASRSSISFARSPRAARSARSAVRRRQDRRYHGTHQQYRQGSRRLLRLRPARSANARAKATTFTTR